MLYSISRSILLFILRLFFRFQVKGKEFLPRNGGFILASNHVSNLDPIALGCASFRALDFMAKQELFSVPVFGRLISLVRAFPVKRNNADLSAMKEAMRRIRAGAGLVLFPEGTRKISEAASEIQSGVGFLAAKLGVPVVPAFIKGTDAALPKGAKFIKPAQISVYFGRQIFVERSVPYQDSAQRIMDSIRHLSCETLN